jgi:hypothetical protein
VMLAALLALAAPSAAQSPRPVIRRPASSAPIRSTPDPRTEAGRIVPPPKPERKKLSTEQARSVRAAAAKATRDRKIAACKAANGAWSAEVRARELYGTGSDVDEIYGHIYATASDGGTYDTSHRAPGWTPNDLWSTNNKNIDLGPPIHLTQFPPMPIRNLAGAQAHLAKIYVHLDLHDEDDGRGGPNDETFLVLPSIGYSRGPANSMVVSYYIKSCEEEPEFRSGSYYHLTAFPRNDSNQLTFDFSVMFKREFP